jgi:hypothetical protein
VLYNLQTDTVQEKLLADGGSRFLLDFGTSLPEINSVTCHRNTILTFAVVRPANSVNIKSSVFWDITPCSPWKITQISEKHITYIFRVEARNQQAEIFRRYNSS